MNVVFSCLVCFFGDKFGWWLFGVSIVRIIVFFVLIVVLRLIFWSVILLNLLSVCWWILCVRCGAC